MTPQEQLEQAAERIAKRQYLGFGRLELKSNILHVLKREILAEPYLQ